MGEVHVHTFVATAKRELPKCPEWSDAT
jgi:hypothetical protein